MYFARITAKIKNQFIRRVPYAKFEAGLKLYSLTFFTCGQISVKQDSTDNEQTFADLNNIEMIFDIKQWHTIKQAY